MPAKTTASKKNSSQIGKIASKIAKTAPSTTQNLSGMKTRSGRVLTEAVQKRRERAVKTAKKVEKISETTLNDVPYDAMEKIFSYLNTPEDCGTLTNLRSINRHLKGAVDFFVQFKKNIPQFDSVKLTKMSDTLETGFNVEIQVRKEVTPLLHNFELLQERMIDISDENEFISFTIEVYHRSDPVVDHLKEAFGRRIEKLEIENVRSLEEWRFIRSMIGDAKIDLFVGSVDTAMRNDSDAFCTDFLEFLKNSSVKTLDFEACLALSNPHAFIDQLIASRDVLKYCILKDGPDNASGRFYGLTSEEFKGKLAPLSRKFSETTVMFEGRRHRQLVQARWSARY